VRIWVRGLPDLPWPPSLPSRRPLRDLGDPDRLSFSTLRRVLSGSALPPRAILPVAAAPANLRVCFAFGYSATSPSASVDPPEGVLRCRGATTADPPPRLRPRPPPPAGNCPPSLARRRALLFPCWRLRLSLVPSVGSARRLAGVAPCPLGVFNAVLVGCGSSLLLLVFVAGQGHFVPFRTVAVLHLLPHPVLRAASPSDRPPPKSSKPDAWSWLWGLAKALPDLVGSASATLVGVVHLAGGVAAAAPMPFGLQSESLSPPSWRDG
jgi:hypothetical protein